MRFLSIEQRLVYEERIERILDAHRQWPRDNPQPNAPFEARVTREALAKNVELDLRKSAALQVVWHSPITAELLAIEVDRMKRERRDPALLRQLFEALDDDRYLIAECLARRNVAATLFAAHYRGDTPEAWLASLDLPRTWREPGPTDDIALAGRAGARGRSLCTPGSLPEGRRFHTAIWTGSEMLIWGGGENGFFATPARYSPASDTWQPMAQGPAARILHSAVWTGTSMIVWGGSGTNGDLSDGGIYDPTTDSWQALPPSGLLGRSRHGAVWSGTEMIVWGGDSGWIQFYYDGARYDVATGTWTPLAIDASTPSPRSSPFTVWAANLMVVWGGGTDQTDYGDGARYDPVADAWSPISTVQAPLPMHAGTALWTGGAALVWNGYLGGRYDPIGDAWSPISGVGAPRTQIGTPAVWTGTEMITWGGGWAEGGRYDPSTDSWVLMAASNAPSGRSDHTIVWTGREAVVFGGSDGGPLSSGARYDPAADLWLSMSAGTYNPAPRVYHSAVWTGVEMIVFGGLSVGDTQTGGRYLPVFNVWLPTSTGSGCPDSRSGHGAVWTGTRMIVWGGVGYDVGGLYDPVTDTWQAMPTDPNEPWPYRRFFATVWTGTEMIVWGGNYAGSYGDGGRFDPATMTWKPMATLGAPSARYYPNAVWTGSEMIVWGGAEAGGVTNTGARYSPTTDTWQPTSLGSNAPSPRFGSTAIWTGREMIVWGGSDGTGAFLRTGGRYDPATDTWIPTPVTGTPSPRSAHVSSWTGTQMIVWGGGASGPASGGGRYDPTTDTWRRTTIVGEPSPRSSATAVWAGTTMIAWGGWYGPTTLDTGGVYDPALDTWSCGLVPSGASALAGKTVSTSSPGASIRGYRADGTLELTIPDAFPALLGDGARVASGNVDNSGDGEILAAPGPVPGLPPQVRGFDGNGAPVPGLDFLAYGTTGYGACVGSGRIDGQDEVLTGPGPSPVYGPHVRAFRFMGGVVSPISKVSFYAYGTLRYGVNVAAGELDGDGFEEILTGAGPGPVFGPHVRGFNYDAVSISALAKVSFYAYGTPRFGVEVGAGDIDGDDFAEILTGPGPSPVFASQLRGFDYDGAAVRAIARVDAVVFTGTKYGLNCNAGDLESDGYDEIVCGPGPDPFSGSRLRALDYDGNTLREIPTLSIDVYGTTYGLRVGAGDVGF